jgi:hypothetical protein
VSFIEDIELQSDRHGWRVNRALPVRFTEPAARCLASTYRESDVHDRLLEREERTTAHCDVGMATAAALFRARPGADRVVEVTVPLEGATEHRDPPPAVSCPGPSTWDEALDGAAEARLPDERWQHLYEGARRSVVLHTCSSAYPGPYTYKRFWFRDAAFILHSLLLLGLPERARRILDTYPGLQRKSGFFHSQDGEWDSNGAALWILRRHGELTGDHPDAAWRKAIDRGARWVAHKRTSPRSEALHAGLLPAGFSAEHLGNNDFYYWDDFWALAGLRAAAAVAEEAGDPGQAGRHAGQADSLERSIATSLDRSADTRRHPGIPASPYRRMDSGAVGSLVASYPLGLRPPDDPGVMGTAEFLYERCRHEGAFFQDMIHSGMNAYLTLHLAQVFLRAGDPRWKELAEAVVDLASPTGQWPEAIHPQTLGGCMGDGQHVWASAEWVAFVRNLFVREEAGRLILAGGLRESWLDSGRDCAFGPTPTPYGPVRVRLESDETGVAVHWQARWREQPAELVVAPPGMPERHVERPAEADSVRFTESVATGG